MSLPGNYVGIAGDRCSCGRRATIRHCPSCGSFKVKLRPSARTEVHYSDKLSIFIDKFICIRCGFVFDDKDRESCEAPVYRTQTEKLIIQAVKIKLDRGGQLSLQERRVLDSVDSFTDRYRMENPLNRLPEPKPEESPQAVRDKKLIRRLEIEYATMCLRLNERASDEGREKYVHDRLAEIAEMDKIQGDESPQVS